MSSERRSRSERFRRMDELFAVLEALDTDERSARLEELERDEPDLFPELRELVQENAATLIGALDDMTALARATSGENERTAAGRRVGPYELVRRLGVGGMGEVWEARQEVPIRRRVALKILRADRVTPSMVARFRSEQQAVAMMDHAHVASAYEAGTTDGGEPWFAMEYIEGVPITSYCDEHRLDLDRRLDLFCTLCDAVQHAHRRGVVHRDLKPANILVATDGGAGGEGIDGGAADARLKIIDFGIAKALDAELLGDRHTLAGDIVGTPEYMSPEQAGFDDGVVDTRTDVYALGVLLFELLAGELPISGRILRSAGIEEMRRAIREFEPPKPSSILESVDGSRTTEIAGNRDTQPESLLRRMRGDLDWIVLKALSKAKAQRYETPIALAEDVRRFLARDPVLAGPPTWRYKTSRWIRKHRTTALITATLLGLVLAGVVSVTAALVRARNAERALVQEVEQERATRRFLVDLFEAGDPFAVDPWQPSAPPSSRSAAELIDRGAARLLDGSIADPTTRARLQLTVGRLTSTLARPEQAGLLLRAALASLDSGTTGPEARRLRAEIQLALGDVEIGTGALDRALEQLDAALDIAPPNDPSLQARAHSRRADALLALARTDEALESAVRAVELARDHDGNAEDTEQPSPLLEALATLANVYLAQGNHDAAVESFGTLLSTQERTLGPAHPRLAVTLRSLSNALDRAGDYDAGAAAAERALDISRTALGDVHPIVAYDLTQVAASHRVRGQYAEALELLREADGVLRETRGDGVERAIAQAEIGMCLEELGHPDEAVDAHREALRLNETVYGSEHPELAPALSRLSSALRAAGRTQESVPHARRALHIVERAHPGGHWRVVVAGAEVAQALLDSGDLAAALDVGRTTSARALEVLGPEHVMHGAVLTIEATALIAAARDSGARSLLDEAATAIATARSIFEEQQGSQSPNLAYVEELEHDLAAARDQLGSAGR